MNHAMNTMAIQHQVRQMLGYANYTGSESPLTNVPGLMADGQRQEIRAGNVLALDNRLGRNWEPIEDWRID